jgi:hypothetical protein
MRPAAGAYSDLMRLSCRQERRVPTVLRVDGFRFFFFSSERDEPALERWHEHFGR